ncbi:MAG: metal-dependent hydrolase, partial [Luminiphilus sp.]|nr:metal-dependent hydrolase [Luminiphilus sp.]
GPNPAIVHEVSEKEHRSTVSDLVVRQINFDVDQAKFIWNPANPSFSVLMNQITFFVVGFEKYMCRAMRDAEAHITDPAVMEEAVAFRKQEAIHAQKHMRHARALIAQYPALQGVLDKVLASYDDVYNAHPLEYHLAYAGGLEAIFTPFFKMILDHRAALFEEGDAQVASLFVWHFCEEIEHRSSAYDVYNHVVGSHWYRIRKTGAFQKHTRDLFDMIKGEFESIVKDVPDNAYSDNPFARIPLWAQLRSAVGVLASQFPWHDSVNQPLPDYYAEWLGHWQSGADVSQIVGKPQHLVLSD